MRYHRAVAARRHAGWLRELGAPPLALAALLLARCAGAPPPDVALVAATDLGPLRQSPVVRGRDGGPSLRAHGRSVWLFGDTTLQRANADGQTWLNDSWSFTEQTSAAAGITLSDRLDAAGGLSEFFPLTPEERAFNVAHRGDPCAEAPCGARWAFWPGAGVVDPSTGRALIFYGKVRAAPGDFNFHAVGHSLATWDAFDRPPVRPVVAPGTAEPTLLFGENDPGFGAGAVLVDGELFAYGCTQQGLAKPCRLARVPLAQALDRRAWRFWSGSGWSAAVADAASLFDGSDILSVSWAPALGRFLAVYSEPLGRTVVLRTAPRPEGPWSATLRLFEAQAPSEGNGWVYDAQAHAEFAEDGGRVQYVTYSRSTGFFEGEFRLVRVTLR